MNLPAIPKSMVIIGAGAVGVEFASIFHRFGTEVTLLEMLPHAVPLEDEEISAELEKSFRKQRIALHTEARVVKVTKTAKGSTVEFTGADGKGQKLETETVLVAVGRAPNTAGVGVEENPAPLERGLVRTHRPPHNHEPGGFAPADNRSARAPPAFLRPKGGHPG